MPRGRENNAIIYYPSEPWPYKTRSTVHFLSLLHKPTPPSVDRHTSLPTLPLPPSIKQTTDRLFIRTNKPSCPAKISWCVHFFYFHASITPPIANNAQKIIPVGHISIRPSIHTSLSSRMPEQPGDIVTVNHGAYGRREGLVIGSHVDYAVRRLPLNF